jgi:type IV pilus assembly protein PilA
MVVVLIIAILLAIAIPTFLGARNAANARSAQSNLRNALTAEQTYWTNNQGWDTAPNPATAGSVAATETALNWSASGAVTPGNAVLVVSDVATNNGVLLIAAAKDGHCYGIEAIDQPLSTGQAAGTYYFDSGNSTANGTGCTVTQVPTMGATAPVTGSAAAFATKWATTF